MVVMGQQVCPLCQTTKDLKDFRKSHFIPAGLYYSGKKAIQYGTRSGTGRLEREIRDLLLCSTCEGLLDQGGESYVLSHIAAKVMDEFPLHRILSLALPRECYPDISRFSGDDLGIDMEKFAHFALGIVWRATIHELARLQVSRTWRIFSRDDGLSVARGIPRVVLRFTPKVSFLRKCSASNARNHGYLRTY